MRTTLPFPFYKIKSSNRFRVLSLLFLFCFSLNVQSQDLENVGDRVKKKLEELEKNPFKINGGINGFMGYNGISGIPRRYDPFTWRLNAKLNIDLFGIKAPFTASLSSGNTIYNYDLPEFELPAYAFVGISPRYKWATLHLGDRSMNFSKFTLSGHSFRGAGIELKPGNFRFSAMYGQLKRAVAEDLNSLQALDPVFKRMGWGVKTGYDDGKNKIGLTVFSAEDDPTSIPPIQLTFDAVPSSNTIVSLDGRKEFGRIFFEAEYALSAFTRDITSPLLETPNEITFLKRIGGLFNPRSSSRYNDAIKGAIGVKTNFGNVQFNYERVDPGYRTLGALFFNDDYENFTTSTAVSMLNKKLNFAANLGLQRNNIESLDNSTAERFIGAVNISYVPSQKWNFNAAYSNFQSTNKIRAIAIPFIQIDSIILSLTTQSVNTSVSYITGKQSNSIFTGIFSFQKSKSIRNEEVLDDQLTSQYLASLAHSYIIKEKDMTLTTSFLANLGEVPGNKIHTFSPTFGVTKGWLDKKLTTRASFGFIRIYTNGAVLNNMLNLQTQVQYKLNKKHVLGLNMSFVNRSVNNSAMPLPEFSEFVGKINYGWTF